MSILTAYSSYSMPLTPNALLINVTSIDMSSIAYGSNWASIDCYDSSSVKCTFYAEGNLSTYQISSLQINKNGTPYVNLSGFTSDQMSTIRSFALNLYLGHTVDPSAYATYMSAIYGGNDTFIGSSGNDAFLGYGGNDTLNGGAGLDSLNGGAGRDLMLGGAGNDTYVVDNSGDVVCETTTVGGSVNAGGTDTVKASVSWTLGSYVENLTLTGALSIKGTGNALANVLIGNNGSNLLSGGGRNDTLSGGAGADTLVGGSGKDVLTGGSGADVFRMVSLTEAGDRIRDFVSGTDKLQFVSRNFGGLTSAQLVSGHRFVSNATGAASGTGAQFVFNTQTGALSYDSNGTRAGGATSLATLNVHSLSARDFLMVVS